MMFNYTTTQFILIGFAIAALVATIVAAILYVTICIEKSPCDTCRHYQPGLNPCGCFVSCASTGAIARTWKKATGCVKYECN